MNDFMDDKIKMAGLGPKYIGGIVMHPSPILRVKTKPVDISNKPSILHNHNYLSALLDNTELGIAIAAPQGGLSCSMFTHRLYGDYETIINPENVIYEDYEQVTVPEACLSLPEGIYIKQGLMRAAKITLDYWSFPDMMRVENRTITGFEAQVFQHEIDHLNGILIIDKIEIPDNIKLI